MSFIVSRVCGFFLLAMPLFCIKFVNRILYFAVCLLLAVVYCWLLFVVGRCLLLFTVDCYCSLSLLFCSLSLANFSCSCNMYGNLFRLNIASWEYHPEENDGVVQQRAFVPFQKSR